MRGIELKWDELSDSKEYYSNRPKPLMSLFIYLILLITIIAIIYGFVGKIEVVSIGSGAIRPNSKISTVSNLVGGKISELLFQDGQFIQAGKPLVVLENTCDTQIEMVNKEIDKLECEIGMIGRYIESLKLHENKFSNNIDGLEYEYYVRFEALQNNAKSITNDNIIESKRLNTSINELKTDIDNLQKEVEMLALLKQSIEQGKDLLKDNPKYQNIYIQYLLHLDMLKTDYNQAIDSVSENDGIQELKDSLYNLELNLKNYYIFLRSLEDGQNYFSSDNDFISNYNEYEALCKQYFFTIKSAENLYEFLIQDKTEGLDSQIEEAKLQIAIAKEALTAFESKAKTQVINSIAALEEKILSVKSELNKANIILGKKENIKDNYILSINNLTLDNKITIESELAIKHQKLQQLEKNLQTAYITLNYNQMNTLENGDSLAFSSLWLNALIDSYALLSTKKSDMDKLNMQKMTLQEQADLHKISAQIDGIINVTTELNKGDVIAANLPIATILSDEEAEYRVLLYVDSKDIVGIEIGSTVKLEIPALPSQVYGNIYGQVLSISKDTKSKNNQQTSYYLVESSIENRKLFDKNGKEANIEVEMIVQGRVIVREMRIVDFILQTLDFFAQ